MSTNLKYIRSADNEIAEMTEMSAEDIVLKYVAMSKELSELKEFKEKIAMKALRHYNCSSQNAMTESEDNALIEALLSCKNPAIYPLGGYCITTITTEDLKKRLS